MRNTKLFLFLTIVVSFFGCGLEKMASDYDKVTYEQTPTVLEVHGGDVVVDLKGTFPEKYFAKKATVEIITVIIGEDGVETKLKSVGFELGEIFYRDNIGRNMVLEILYDNKKILPGDLLPKTSKIDLVLGNGKKSN